MIVGTAGHIDHGKTTLVRTLTGVDTDRLKEEKARGISIELGYAYTPLANGDVLGFVDVPGHERLVHTMVAGATGIDFALLVVAADDGIMPQTREHLAILDLLGVSRGAVALTKADRADDARVRAATRDIEALLAPTPLAASKIFAVDARTDDARMAALRDSLDRAATDAGTRSARGLFRLAVDRVFTLAGHGTIATGTIVSGRVAVGDAIEVMPSGRTVRVRGIHAQNRAAESGRAGERCAINLAGIERSELARGDWLADPRALATTSRVDVALRATRDRAAPIADGTKVHVHIGTSHRTARVVALAPGYAQLVLDAPLCATPGDRFIVRDAAAAHTIGGGTVLDPFAPVRQRRSAERLAYLDAVERMLAGDGVGPLIAVASHGVRVSNLVRIANDASIANALPQGTVLLDGEREPFVIAVDRLRVLRERVIAAASDFHATFPDEPGLGSARLCRIALPGAPADVWTALVKTLLDDGSLVQNGAYLRRPEHRVRLSDRESELAAELLPRIDAGGFDPPWVRDLAVAVGASEDEVRQTLRKLNAEGSLQQIVRDLFYTPERVRELAAIARGIADADGAIEAAVYRDAIGLGRKRTVQILEFFDRVGYTRRVRDAHRLREGVSF